MTKPTVGVRAAATVTMLPLLFILGACTAAPASTVATDTDSVTHDQNERVPEDAAWTQHYFPSSDGSDVELHADVLLPEDLAEGEEVPVILSVGSYFAHAGEIGVEDWKNAGPSTRFSDLVEGTDLFNRGYALVQVDLRGYGGSSGCQDFMGQGEQADVAAAIDWVSQQSWSTGDVGMYGKSYDAITGLVGNNLNNDALKAVVAQEPMWDLSRSMRSNGVPRSPIVDSSRSYNDAAAIPALPDDDDRYTANSASAEETADATCALLNSISYRIADPQSDFWTARNLAEQATGTDTPLFITQGFLENVTAPEAFEQFLTNHDGQQRGWLGPWGHVRGNQLTVDGKQLEMGREGWFDETMSFFDEHLKGIEPTTEYPAFAVQDNSGLWRAQDTWPVVDSNATIALGGGSYLDDGAEGDPAVDTGNSFIQQSEPVTTATRITGTPRVSLTAGQGGNVMVNLFDVAPDGSVVLFDEQVAAINPGESNFELKSTDWTLAPGHALAVKIGTIESSILNNWIATPSNQTIEITDAQLDLALDDPSNDVATPGDRAPYLDTFTSTTVQQGVIGAPTFTVPAAGS